MASDARMPAHPKSPLVLDLSDMSEVEECDIGQFSRSTSPSSSAFPTPLSSYGPSFLDLPRQTSLVQPRPSSPFFSTGRQPPLSAGPMSRSRTLPRGLNGLGLRSSGLEGLEVSTDLLVKMQRWVLGLAIVDFDLDTGPVTHGVFPPIPLSPAESENIAFSSFPDSVQFDQGSQAHSFRVRESDRSCKLIRPGINQAPNDGFIYGFAYFTQKADETSKRGYQQRSLVILTYHQYPALFSALSQILGPLYQLHGLAMLETACHNISNWPDPKPGMTIELGFLGSVLQVELPLTVDTQQLNAISSFDETELHILASCPPLTPPPLLLFESSLSSLWSIWECLVLCEPILVFASSPAATSQAIWWFRDLLRPIPLMYDIRPYFTIHDQDHAALVNKLPPKAGILIGVTNPFIERSCKHWPHVLSLGRTSQARTPTKGLQPVAMAGPPPGWKTKTHKRYTSKDRHLLKRLEDACESGERARLEEVSIDLRRDLCSRTISFLIPLNRYLNTLIPLPAELTSSYIPRLKPFSSRNFFASLKAHGSPLQFRSASALKEFYARWLRTPAFGLWLTRQEEMVHSALREKK